MRVSSISPFDPFAAAAVKPTAKESDGKGAEDGPTPDHQHAEHPARPLVCVFLPDRLELIKGAPALRRARPSSRSSNGLRSTT